jgi:hypothetical protein
MGRTKSDSPLKFPWDKIFSEDERQLDNAIEYCKSNSSGSENLKRAVTAIGYGYNSGSKSVLCERIREKAKQIRFQIDKANPEDRDELRDQVIYFYRQTYLKKFEGKEEGIDNIRIPDRPDLPFLNENEKTMFNSVSPPSSPRGGPSGGKKTIIIEEDDEIVESREDKLLRAEVIVYFKNAPIVGGKRSINGSEIYNIIKTKYTHPLMLDKDNVKRVIREVSGIFNTLTQSKIKESEKLIAIKKDKVAQPKPIEVVSREPRKAIIIEEEDEEDVKMPSIPKLVLPTSQVSSNKGLSENEVLHFIRKKGWPEPLIQSKESLCDYVLRKIRDEDEKSEGEYRGIREDIDRLSNNLIALTEMYENRLNEIEKIQKQQKKNAKQGKSVTWGENEIREYENEKEEIKEQIEETKAQLEEVKQLEKEKEEVVEEKRQMCFRMRDWLDRDDFDRVEVEKDLMCDNDNICNVERGECESGITSLDEYAEIGVSKIKGKKDSVDRIKNKFTKVHEPRKVIIEEEEEVAPPKPRKVMIIEEDEDEPGSEVEMPTLNEIKPIVKAILLRNKDNLEGITFKQIMKELNSHFKVDLIGMKTDIKKMVKRQMDKLPRDSEVSEITKGIEEMKIVEPSFREEPEVSEITTGIEEMKIIEDLPPTELQAKPIKSCNTISFDEDVSDEIRAQDLMCDEGDVCDLDTSKCIPEIEAIEPVEELTIGGVLLKVTGKNKIVQALKEKIYRAGGEIPVVEEEVVSHELPEPSYIREEPAIVKEEVKMEEEVKVIEKSLSEMIEESKAHDVFASNIPNKRPTLEEIVRGIDSIKRETSIVSPQTKIRVAEKRCIDRIAMCAGIKLM